MKEIKVSWIILSGFIGIILGTVFANCMEHMEPGILEAFAIDQYPISSQTFQNWKSFGLYLARRRGIQTLVMLGVGLLCHTMLLMLLLALFGGILWGLILSLESMRMGLQGLFLAISCFLPQGCFYVLALWLFLTGKERVRQQSMTPAKAIGRCILLPLLLTVAGVLLELMVSPELIRWVEAAG